MNMNNIFEKYNSHDEIKKIIDEFYLQQLLNTANKDPENKSSLVSCFEDTTSNVNKTLDFKIQQFRKCYFDKNDIINNNNFYSTTTFDLYNAKQATKNRIRNLGSNRLKPLGISKTYQQLKSDKRQVKCIKLNFYNTANNLTQETEVASAAGETGIISLRNRNISQLDNEPTNENLSNTYSVPDNSYDEGNDNIDFSSSDDPA